MILYGHDREWSRLTVLGKATLSENHIKLDFGRAQLEWLGQGTIRPFVFVASRSLSDFPAIPAEVLEQPLEVRVWANPKGKRLEHRPLAWAGWVVSADLLLLRPAMPLEQLAGLETRQDGFASRRRPDGTLYDLPSRYEAPECPDDPPTSSSAPSASSTPAPAPSPAPPSPGTSGTPRAGSSTPSASAVAPTSGDSPPCSSSRSATAATDSPTKASPASVSGLPRRWDEQVAWIKARVADTPVEDIADALSIPLEHVFGAMEWEPPVPPPKRKKKPRSLDSL